MGGFEHVEVGGDVDGHSFSIVEVEIEYTARGQYFGLVFGLCFDFFRRRSEHGGVFDFVDRIGRLIISFVFVVVVECRACDIRLWDRKHVLTSDGIDFGARIGIEFDFRWRNDLVYVVDGVLSARRTDASIDFGMAHRFEDADLLQFLDSSDGTIGIFATGVDVATRCTRSVFEYFGSRDICARGLQFMRLYFFDGIGTHGLRRLMGFELGSHSCRCRPRVERRRGIAVLCTVTVVSHANIIELFDIVVDEF